jgi:hypothetical protein
MASRAVRVMLRRMRWVARSALLAAAGLVAATAAAETLPQTPPRRQFEIGTHEGVPWPIEEAPVDGAWPSPPVFDAAPPPPPNRAGARVIKVLGHVAATMTSSSYKHATRVDVRAGSYDWDCSGMTAWVLRRAAPAALRGLRSARPVARTFAAAIEKAPTTKARNGWQRIANIADVMPGDVFAWRRPRGMPSKNTGHVGFVVDRPRPVPGLRGGWAVRIIDSTSFSHQDDTRHDDLDGGFGTGTVTFLADADGRVTHYGWHGTRSDWYVITPVVFGRVSR